MGSGCTDLAPSAIRYTQSSIKNTFERPDEHEGELIGHTLDDLCNGDCQVKDIPVIKVFEKNGHYWSADNRRLWVFKQFNRLGGCGKVPVKVVSIAKVNSEKFTTRNGGATVKIRGDPGGYWYKQPDRSLARHRGTVHTMLNHTRRESPPTANQGRQSEVKSESNNCPPYYPAYRHEQRWPADDMTRSPPSPRRHHNSWRHNADEEGWFTARNVVKALTVGYVAFKLIRGVLNL